MEASRTHAGEDAIAIFVSGILFREATKAKEVLEGRGKTVRLLQMQSIAPIDEAAVLTSTADASAIVTLEEHSRASGLYAKVAELIARHRLRAQIIPIAFNCRRFKPLPLDDALEFEGFAGMHIADRILGELGHTC